MICNFCGAQLPDGSPFCAQCGASFDTVPRPSQPANQPVYQQPVYPQSQQVQPQQPFGAQPAYGQSYAPQRQVRERVPLDPKKKQAIVIAVACVAVLAMFLVMLFVTIIPAASGTGASNSDATGKLRHIWRNFNGYEESIMNFMTNQMSVDGQTRSVNWKVQGNHLILSLSTGVLISEPYDFLFTMTADGRYLVLYGVGRGYSSLGGVDSSSDILDLLEDRPEIVFTRVD